MPMKFISASAYSYNSSYTKSIASVNPKGATLMIAHYVRGNPYVRLGSPPRFGDQWFTASTSQLGVGTSADCTSEMFHLFNTQMTSDTFIMYQGTQGDAGTVQNIHCVLIFASASRAYDMQIEYASGSVDMGSGLPGQNPTITANATQGALVFNRIGHDNDSIITATSNQTYVSRSDYGGYTSYWAYAIPETTGPITFEWALNNSQIHSNTILSVREILHRPTMWFIQDD